MPMFGDVMEGRGRDNNFLIIRLLVATAVVVGHFLPGLLVCLLLMVFVLGPVITSLPLGEYLPSARFTGTSIAHCWFSRMPSSSCLG